MQNKDDLAGGVKQKASADTAFALQSTPSSKKPARESVWQGRQAGDSDNDLLADDMEAELEDAADDP